MLHRTSLPTNAFVSGLEDPVSVPLLTGRWRQWTLGLHLPSTLQGYLFFLLCLLILAFTMVLHITLSAENMHLDQKLATLKGEYARTERINANLVWEISQSTSLAAVNAQAVALGYSPITEFKYVVMGDESTLAGEQAPADIAAGSAGLVEPSAANPVIVLPGAQSGASAATAQQALPFETPGMQMALTESAPDTGQDVSPAERSLFSMQGLRAAANETLRWIQDRLPGRR